ncbi:hypothetical protein [Streptomyces rishiriensis]|uniref:hypothetical protein n=1 Tax=Streptomyces rishiriensis TaxID=68264 RepID=UPI001C3F90D4|nr:hypothetical protein [Streptomyces rishiriensis]
MQSVLSRNPFQAAFPIGSSGVPSKAKYTLRVEAGEVVGDLAALQQHVQRHDRGVGLEDAEVDVGESGHDSTTLSPGWIPRETSRFAPPVGGVEGLVRDAVVAEDDRGAFRVAGRGIRPQS